MRRVESQLKSHLLTPSNESIARQQKWGRSKQSKPRPPKRSLAWYSSTVLAKLPLLHICTNHSRCNTFSPTPSNSQAARSSSRSSSFHGFFSGERSCSHRPAGAGGRRRDSFCRVHRSYAQQMHKPYD